MKISIENFKSIKSLQNFEIKPFTVISGVNSSGKSAFIQLLLLLKQTIESDSSNKPLLLDGKLYKVKEFRDVITNKDLKRKLKVSFEFNKSEFPRIEDLKTISILNSLGDYKGLIGIKYDINLDNDIYISQFLVDFASSENKVHSILFKSDSSKTFSIDTNSPIFGKELFYKKPSITNIHFSSIYPRYYESKREEDVEIGDHEATDRESSKEVINIEDIKAIIDSFFQNISYFEPIRDLPKDDYYFSEEHNSTGTKGEFVAQILEENADESITFYEVSEQDNGVTYQRVDGLLIDAVRYWMCDVFGVAAGIETEKVNDTYRIMLISQSGLPISIKHVGFGISQLLPVVVEGLRMPENGTLVIEQPEIHLHPKVQSLLYDFLYGLTLQGKTIIVETHSSHFITRMRRRIAEDKNNEMDDRINLTFIENDIFRTIELDDYGILSYFPEDFVEESSTELRAIVEAQMSKRLKNR